MYEFDSVSASSYEASSLAAKLTEKSGDGWEVVAIVPAGSDITAFLKRETRAGAATTEPAAATTAATTEPVAVSEPAGWGSAPAAAAAGTEASGWGATTSGSDTGGWGSTTQAASAPAAATPASAATATPSVPAGWYADPAGRYELRYWDGSAWTEHVSRAGQQYTDPPVA